MAHRLQPLTKPGPFQQTVEAYRFQQSLDRPMYQPGDQPPDHQDDQSSYQTRQKRQDRLPRVL